jgi:hypothetical protein
MPKHSKKVGRRNFLIAGVTALGIGAVALLETPKFLNPTTTSTTSTTTPTTSTVTVTTTSPTTVTTTTPTTTTVTSTTTTSSNYFQQAVTAFNSILDRTKFRIYSASGQIMRDLRDEPYSNGLQYGGVNPWVTAFIRCDDCDFPNQIDMKADILFSMYYKPHNDDRIANGWGDVPVVECDTCYCGAYMKDVLIDNTVVHAYMAGNTVSAYSWIHYNLPTGDVKTLSWKNKLDILNKIKTL